MTLRLRITTALFVPAMLLGLVACTKSDGREDSTPNSEVAGVGITEEWLLSPDQVGIDWTKQLSETFSDRSKVPVLAVESWCPDAAGIIDEMKGLAGDAGAIVSFKRTEGQGSSHTIIEQVWQAEGAAKFVSRFGDAVETCDGKTWSSTENEDFDFASLDVPDSGDQGASGVSTILTTDASGSYEWVERMIAVRVGETVVQMREVDVHPADQDDKFTVAEWLDFVVEAVEKIEDLAAANSL